MIDYWLGSASKGAVTLEIVDAASGQVVRNFSSADQPEVVNPKDFNVPMYWVRPARTLSASAGMHRFLWDLTYPAPEVLTRDYPIFRDLPRHSSLSLGATVLPRPIQSRAHRRRQELYANARTKDGPACQDLARRSAPSIRPRPQDRRSSAQRLRSPQTSTQSASANKMAPKRSAFNQHGKQHRARCGREIAAELDAKAALIEGEEGGATYLSTPAGRSLSRLNGGLNALLSALDTADAAPTTQQSSTFEELEKALEARLSLWSNSTQKKFPR